VALAAPGRRNLTGLQSRRAQQKRRVTPAAIQQKWCGVYFCRPASKSRAGCLPY